MTSFTAENFSKEAWAKMIEQVQKICDEYGLVTPPEDLLDYGLDELFYKDGTMIDSAMELEIEKGKKWAFGDRSKEVLWATYAGD